MDRAGSVIDGLNTPQGKFWIIGILLHALEKNMKDEFVCPCERIHNQLTSILYTGIPFGVTLYVAYHALDNKVKKKCLHALATAMTWLSFCLLDGRYMTCGLSGEGEYTKTSALKFCKPLSGNDTALLENKLEAQKWMSWSQDAGCIMILVIFILMVICQCHCKQATAETTQDEMQDLNQ